MTPEERPDTRAYEPILPIVPAGVPEPGVIDPFFVVAKDASANECTGLMPAMAEDEDEGESLSRIESIHRIKGKDEKN